MEKILAVIFVVFCLSSCVAETKGGREGLNANSSRADLYLSLLESSSADSVITVKELEEGWQMGDVAMVLEVSRFIRNRKVNELLGKLLKEKSGKKFALESDEWRQWLWSQEYEADRDYADFKSKLYSRIDPNFKPYFKNKLKSTIRLDEVRWGGVIQDGIPPLRNPKMVSVAKSGYLSDGDVVFGIEVDGDFRAYPKRILAWHEMFTDTIKGVPLAGVY